MHNYNINDFLSYYTGAYILHPTTDTVVKVVSQARNDPGSVLLSDKTTATLAELDWKHVQTPALGYRHMADGKALYYVQRHAGRRREKGVTPAAIKIEIPAIINTLSANVGFHADVLKMNILSDKLAEILFRPTFETIDKAVHLLATKKHCLGFAIANDWAVTLGLFKDAAFLLHFKNSRVANSKDGKSWQWEDEDAEYIFNRSGLR